LRGLSFISDGAERRREALLEKLACLLDGLPHLDDTPAASGRGPGDVDDAARRRFEGEVRSNVLVELLGAVRVVQQHCDRHVFLLGTSVPLR